MTEIKIEVLDTTLRDGAQTAEISYSLQDKITIASLLGDFGVDFVELGTPMSNKKDAALCNDIPLESADGAAYVAFASTMHKGGEESTDPFLQSAVRTSTKWISIFGKAHSLHISKVLGVSMDENLQLITRSIAYLKANGKKVIFEAEHFFEGYKLHGEYSLHLLSAALKAGADRLVLCDTNGATLTADAVDTVKQVTEAFPDTIIGVHFHNDLGMAVANTVAAVQVGARHIQGTMLGIGERCGNANLSVVLPTLQLKLGYNVLPEGKLRELTSLVTKIAEIANVTLPADTPYVGSHAFTHKAGMHCDGVIKDSYSFEHVNPADVGNERKLLFSEISGRSALKNKLLTIFPQLKDAETAKLVLDRLKEKENEGYVYETADASLVVTTAEILDVKRKFFELVYYKVIVEQPSEETPAIATVKIKVGTDTKLRAENGDGPVHALDLALRGALAKFYPTIAKISLIDYKVRVINPEMATQAFVRVLITCTDGEKQWTTVGISKDIIEASFIALSDSVYYVLMR